MSRISMSFVMAVATLASVAGAAEPVSNSRTDAKLAESPVAAGDLYWHAEYSAAVRDAKKKQRMLFIFIHNEGNDVPRDAFVKKVLGDQDISAQLSQFTLLKVPVSADITVDGQRSKLLQHGAFSEMLNRQGVAIVDLKHKDTPYYHHVVSTFPFTPGTYYPKRKIDAILKLPAGTLTQRTMIYAVRTYADAPQSANGATHSVLVDAAAAHSHHQASIHLQGHHNWETRFHQLHAQLPPGHVPTEVAAESWPGETLVEAAEECVYCWRRSSGHWRSVNAYHPFYGYDMKRGSNGIWYATGIFGKR